MDGTLYLSDPSLVVYEKLSPLELVEVTNIWSAFTDEYYRSASFHLKAGVDYFIRADLHGSERHVKHMFRPPAPNDAFENAYLIPALGTAVNAFSGGGAAEPDNGSLSSSWRMAETLWWRWNAPATGAFEISHTNTSENGFLLMYRGTALTNLTPVPGPSTSYRGALVRFTIPVEEGESVAIAHYAFGPVPFSITVSFSAGKVNFSPETAAQVDAEKFTADFSRAPGHIGDRHFLWYKWRAPYAGALKIYEAGGITNLIEAGWAEVSNATDLFSRVNRVVAGREYYIQMQGQGVVHYRIEVEPAQWDSEMLFQDSAPHLRLRSPLKSVGRLFRSENLIEWFDEGLVQGESDYVPAPTDSRARGFYRVVPLN